MQLTPITRFEPAPTTEQPSAGTRLADYLAEDADDGQADEDTTA